MIRSTPFTFLASLVPAALLVALHGTAEISDPLGGNPFDIFMTCLLGLLVLVSLYRTGVWLLGPQLNRYEVGAYTLTARTLRGATTFEWHTIDTVVFVGSRLTWRNLDSLGKGLLHLRVRASGVWHDLPYLLVPGDQRQLGAWKIISAACDRHRVELQTETDA